MDNEPYHGKYPSCRLYCPATIGQLTGFSLAPLPPTRDYSGFASSRPIPGVVGLRLSTIKIPKRPMRTRSELVALEVLVALAGLFSIGHVQYRKKFHAHATNLCSESTLRFTLVQRHATHGLPCDTYQGGPHGCSGVVFAKRAGLVICIVKSERRNTTRKYVNQPRSAPRRS